MKFDFWQFAYGQPYVGEAVGDSEISRIAYCKLEQCRLELEKALDEPLRSKLKELMDLCGESDSCHATDLFCAGVSIGLQTAFQLLDA